MRRLPALLAAATLVLTACGDDDAGDAAEQAPTTTDTVLDPEPDQSEDGAAVVAAAFTFEPPDVVVAAGETVVWSNEDGVGHTVTAGTPDDPTGEFDEDLEAGGTVEVVFDEPGTVPYYCEIHPTMLGEVVVR